MATITRKRGRPAKNPRERMFFGIKCTEAEMHSVWHKIHTEELTSGRNKITVSDFFLKGIGVR